MQISTQLNQGTYDVTLNGEFTFNDHVEFRSILQKMEDKEVQHVIFNMAGVDFVDSAALGMLLLALDVVEKTNKRLVVSGVNGQVEKMFNLARFHTLFMMN